MLFGCAVCIHAWGRSSEERTSAAIGEASGPGVWRRARGDEPAQRDAERATRSSANFLWTTFTRFDPAADIHAAQVELVHHHPAFTPPIVIDARMKPS